jgi:hypothetical protein
MGLRGIGATPKKQLGNALANISVIDPWYGIQHFSPEGITISPPPTGW